MKILLTTLNAKYVHTSLGLRNLAAYCRKEGFDVSVKEYTINHGLPQILSDIYSQKPDVIGLACYIWNIRMVLELCSLLKKVMPNVTLILGGPEVSYDPAEVMQSHTSVDYVISGEGEVAFSELLNSLSRSEFECLVSGVSFRKGDQVHVNGQAQVPMLDSLPFAYQEQDMEELGDRIMYYESSRGCPFSCQYCLSSTTAGVRFFSLQRVLQELQVFIDHDVKQVKFVDRTFNTRKEHYMPIIQFLAKQTCRTNFHFEIAADLLSQDVIELLTTAPVGRFQLEVGIQSTYEPTLNAIKRQNDWNKIVSNVSQLQKAGNIHLHLDLIIGLPFENLQRFSQSFNSVYSLRPHMLQIGFLKLLKGSGLRNAATDHDYVYSDDAPYEVLGNRYLDYSEIRELHVIEEVFNLTYNSGRFQTTLQWMIETLFGGNAFAYYQKLSCFWQQEEMNMLSHGPKAIYAFLLDYCREAFPSYISTCLEMLKFDALMADGGTLRPEFLPWNYPENELKIGGFWRDEVVVRHYLPDYHFTSWREIKRNYQIELFAIDLPDYLQTGIVKECRTMLLFDYRLAKPSWSRLPQFLTKEDFE